MNKENNKKNKEINVSKNCERCGLNSFFTFDNFVKGNTIYSKYNLNVKYISIDKFCNELIDSIKDNKMDIFRDEYKKVDVLLIDNIQYIAGKTFLQEELLHIFNYLYENQKQIVIGCDCKPKELQEFSVALKTRFECGLIADMVDPEYETRFAILKNKQTAQDIDDEILTLIASKSYLNIREMEGLVNTVSAYQILLKRPITKEKIEMLIEDIVNRN